MVLVKYLKTNMQLMFSCKYHNSWQSKQKLDNDVFDGNQVISYVASLWYMTLTIKKNNKY